MKKLLSFIVLALMSLTLMASPVEPEKAALVAKNFVAQYVKGADLYTAEVVYTHLMPKSKQPAMYVVNVGNTFVLVSANDVAHPVLGYSLSRQWPTQRSSLPPQVASYLDDLAGQIESAAGSHSDQETAAEWQQLTTEHLTLTTNLPDSVGPMLTTTWNQSPYYNALCPEDANGQAVTGCVATAMAQIINYWGYPIHGRGIHSYNSNYGILSVNYDSATYDYANMPDALTSTSTPVQVNAVATLMRDCGVAVNMYYSSEESSAFDQDARAGLINFFRFSPNMSYAEKESFTSAEWDSMLRENIAAGMPLLYGGDGYAGGHAFVCDGYKTDDYFHFNFGWGGYADGWYLTSSVNPAYFDFSSFQDAIFGIVPDSTGNIILGQSDGTSTFTVDEPLELYHLMGHNAYTGANYTNSFNNTVLFSSADPTKQLVLDIISFEDQNINVYDVYSGSLLTALYGGSDNDLSPVVSTNHALGVVYHGNYYYDGFHLRISQDNGCRMVSNIVASVDTTTVHLAWTENGSATQWQIEYGEEGFAHGSGTLMTVNNAIVDITFPQRLTKYDVYIRSVCAENMYSPWAKISIFAEAPYWQDIVTSQPEGYVLNEATNTVEISTAEGLAWWAKTDNTRDAMLNADIDLSGYKWRPVECHNFNGNGHVVSNAYIVENSSWVGFFSYLLGECKDLGLVDFYVKSSGTNTGGLCGQMGWSGWYYGSVTNCYVSNGTVIGTDYVGGMIGFTQESSIINCYANVTVVGNRWSGLMVGNAEHQTIRNSYAAGGITMRSYCYNAGIASYISTGIIDHCYSVELPMGVVGYSGSTVISDTSTFVRENDNWILRNPVSFDGMAETDLLDALNKGVEMMNDENMRVWTIDNANINNGYPVLGNHYTVTCSNIDSLSVTNIKIDSTPCVLLSWTDTSNSSQYEIRYLKKNAPRDSMVTITTNNHYDTLYGIPLGHVYDFSVRSVCDENTHGAWTTTQIIVDLPYWTDIVTTQPLGFVEDSNGNIEISTAEGLAWLSVLCNGLHGQEARTFENKLITLTEDISLAGYRWRPIGENKRPDWRYFSGSFDGNNHSISDIYILDSRSYHGLFGEIFSWNEYYIKNVNMVGGSISSIIGDVEYEGFRTNQSCIGGLAGCINHANEISNCHSSVNVSGLGAIGSLIGQAFIQGGTTSIFNCSATGEVYGREACGGLIGECYGTITVMNSYATGDVHLFPGGINAWYRGGLIGNFQCNVSAFNCYSTGVVEIENSLDYGKVIGSAYTNPHIHYIYGDADSNPGMGLFGGYCEDVSDTTQFYHNGNANTLTTPITINGEFYTDLKNVLNAWVISKNDSKLKTWILDSTTGYPVFGNYYEPSCYNPSDLIVSNATNVGDTVICTGLAWNQIGNPIRWDVLYVATGHSINEGAVVSVYSNPCVLTGIPIGAPLDFYVRAVCDSNDFSGWCDKVTYIPDKLRWTEVVTLQPEGYVEDDNNNIIISTAEGLAWLSSVSNSLNGTWNNLDNKHVFITSDIDVSTYRWTPINSQYLFLDGMSHSINGVYCNELQRSVGFVGGVFGGVIKNVCIMNCSVKGLTEAGGLAGYSVHTQISNCLVTGNISAIMTVGGFVGQSNYSSMINSCFVGNIEARSDIVYEDATRGYIGGFLSSSYQDTLINNYVVSEVPSETYSAIIIESAVSSVISNNYCKNYPTNIPLVPYDYTNISSFTGSGNIWTLNSPPFINGIFYTNLVDALNAWVDAYDTTGIYRHWAADSTGENNGYPVFAAIPCTPATGSDSIVVCDSYTWHGNIYTVSTELMDTLSTMDGCDSIVTHYLTVNHPTHTSTAQTACETYNWNGTDYTTGGDYTYSHQDANGCTQVDTLHLTINFNSTGDTSAVACDNFTWYGTAYTASATPTHVFTNAAGCDSTVTLNLTVNHSTTSSETATACESYLWSGQWLVVSGQYFDTNTNAAGCDSVVTLNLTINNPVHTAITETACNSYTWNGITYTTSGDYTYSHPDANGCTQVDTLHLTINYSNTGDTTAVACDNFTWYGTAYTASATPTHVFTNAAGCDSTVTLNLTINHSTTSSETATACESYLWSGQWLVVSGQYFDTNTNATGCDSIVTLNLTINNPVNTATTETACNSYTWNGITYTTSGDYTYSHPDANGCTQVDTLHLTINNPVNTATTETACDSYTWQGTDYTASGDYTYSHFDANGCTQVDTLHLTINNGSHNAESETVCDNYTWNGNSYTESGTYTYDYANSDGCASVDTLLLTVHYSVETTVTETAEENYTWNGTTYTESGSYTWVGETAEGCDSTVTLNLTVTSHEGIGEVGANDDLPVRVYVVDGLIIVDNSGVGANNDLPVRVYDVTGRQYPTFTSHVSPFTLPDGVYLVKVGDYPARRVVIIR